MLERVGEGGGRRKGRAPEGDAWFVDGVVVKGKRAIFSTVW